MTLLDCLKDRYSQAEKYTKANFIDDIERSVSDYDAREVSLADTIKSSGAKGINQRYEFVIPLIFTNTESMKASLWDRLPDLIFKGRGTDDEDKKRKVEAAYKYLKDKLDLETFAFAASHWFILGGFVSAFASFKSETYDAPIYDDNGTPQIDPLTGETSSQTLYSYNDPVLELGDPRKVFYSSESEYSINADKVPFLFRTKLMTVEEIEKTYGVKVDPDTELSINNYDAKENQDDIKRSKVCFYLGSLPEQVKKEVKDWESGVDFMVIYTDKKILYNERQAEKLCKLAKWYGQPNAFFGFGFGKIGRQFQKEKSIRRGQEIRLADVAAYPKWAIKNDGVNKIDISKLIDPRENIVLTYESDPPSILAPGDLSKVVTAAAQEADQDAQQAFGMMDISQGSQNATVVKTATGQSIFADAAEKRVKLAKNNFMKFYQAVVIMLLKLCQANWDEEKLVTITDEDGQEQEVSISREDLQGIDFDKDIEINAESASSNKDVMRQQYISLYDKVKDDPLIDRKPVFKDMVRYGFDIRSPERYLNKSTLQPGMALSDQMGNQYVVDKSGQVVSAQDMNELGTPSGQDNTPNSADALMGSINNVGTGR